MIVDCSEALRDGLTDLRPINAVLKRIHRPIGQDLVGRREPQLSPAIEYMPIERLSQQLLIERDRERSGSTSVTLGRLAGVERARRYRA